MTSQSTTFTEQIATDNQSLRQLAEKVNHQSKIFDLALNGMIDLAERQGVGSDWLDSLRTEWQNLRDDVKQLTKNVESETNK